MEWLARALHVLDGVFCLGKKELTSRLGRGAVVGGRGLGRGGEDRDIYFAAGLAVAECETK